MVSGVHTDRGVSLGPAVSVHRVHWRCLSGHWKLGNAASVPLCTLANGPIQWLDVDEPSVCTVCIGLPPAKSPNPLLSGRGGLFGVGVPQGRLSQLVGPLEKEVCGEVLGGPP